MKSPSPKLQFYKYSGAGNDFILLDNRGETLPLSSQLIESLCHRKMGIGADGVILLENSDVASIKMRIFNADGSEAEMCGNGVRCLIRFAQELGIEGDLTVQTVERVLATQSHTDTVTVEMGQPTDIQCNLTVDGLRCHHLNTGVPHLVLFDDVDIEVVGPLLRYHPTFDPQGVNVNVARIVGDTVHVRTYERGVEAETLACGTGATASALAACEIKGLKSPVQVIVASGDTLTVQVSADLSNPTLRGPVIKTFEGRICLPQVCLA
jgi:diaminopimelate epimerase